MRIDTTRGCPAWQLQGAEVAADAAARLRHLWQAQAHLPLPLSVRGMDWRAQTVFWLLAAPERWGVLGAILAPRLLAGSGRTGIAGILEMLDTSGASVERIELAATPQGAVVEAGSGLQLCRDGDRFGVWRNGAVDWPDAGKRYGGLCHALVATVTGSDVAGVADDDVRPMIESLPAIVCDTPDTAVALWQELMGSEPTQARCDSVPMPAGAMLQRGLFWAAGGVAAYALEAGGAPGLTAISAVSAISAGALEAIALTEAVVRLSCAGADPAERAKYEAALALALPPLARADIKGLMARLEGAGADVDFFHLTGALRRRLAARAPGQTAGDVIARFSVRDIERAARENAWRARACAPVSRPGGEQLLRMLLELAHESGLLRAWGNAQEISTEPYARRVAHWNHQLDIWDRQASTQRRAAVVHVARNATAHAPAFGVTASAHEAVDLPNGCDTSDTPSDATDPLLNAAIAITSSGIGAALRQGAQSRAVQLAGVGLAGTTALAVGRYAYEGTRAWLQRESDVPIDDLTPGEAYRHGRAEASRGLQDSLNLDQLLALSRWLLWKESEADQAAMTAAYTAELFSNVLARRTNGSVPANLSALLSAPVVVRYRETPFPVGGAGYGVPHGTLLTYKTFTLQDIALGQHFREEFLKIAGGRRVNSVNAIGNATDVASVLSEVDTDAFRQALYDQDTAHINDLSRSPAAIGAFSQYINARAFHTVMQAMSTASHNQSEPIATQSAAEYETMQTLQLVTFQKCVVAGLLAAVHSNGASALLISLKHGTSLWWDATVETTDAFRDFMRSHLSVIERERLENPLRIDDLYFRIGPPPEVPELCRVSVAEPQPQLDEAQALALSPGVRTFLLSLTYFDPDFKFLPSDAIHEQLWQAEIRAFRDNLDVKIVTRQARDERDWEQVKQAMFQASSAFFPLLFGAFPGSPLVAPIVFGTSVGAGVASMLSIAQSTEKADIRDLRKAHSELQFGGLMMITNFMPVDTQVSRAVKAAFSYTGTAAREIITRGEAIVNAPPAGGRRRRRLLVERAERLVREASMPGALTPQALESPWDTITRLRSERGVIDYQSSQRAVAVMDGLPWGFLGSRLVPVKTFSELLQLPPGYPIAFADSEGKMFLAGVTLGAGRVMGKSADDNNALLPTEFALLDFADKAMHADVLSFGSDGRVNSDGETIRIFVDESIRELVPPLSMPDVTIPQLAPRPTRPSRPSGRPRPSGIRPTLVPDDAGNRTGASGNATRPSGPSGHSGEASDGPVPDPVRLWTDVVARWRAGTPVADGPPVPAITYNSPATIARKAVSALSEAFLKQWQTPDFADAMARVLASIETGVLLWRMSQLPVAHQRMVRRHLQGNDSLMTAQLDDAPLHGVVALSNDSDHLLLSLTTGEVLLWHGDRAVVGKPELQDFIARHLSEFNLFGYSHALDIREGRTVGEDSPHLTFVTRLDKHAAVARDIGDRLTSNLRCRAGVRGGCARYGSMDDDTRYLVAYAAQVLPAGDRDTLLGAVQAVHGTAGRRRRHPPHIYTFDQFAPSRDNGLDLPFAHFLGQTIEGFAADAFRRLPGSKTLAQTVAFARIFTEEQLARYAWHVGYGDVGALVESGVGDDAFGYALSEASRPARNGRYAAAISATLGQILKGMPESRSHGPGGAFLKIADSGTLRAIPPGYRLFLGEAALLAEPPGRLYEMISLGNGTAAAWDRSPTTGGPPRRLQRIDLAGENDLIRFTREGLTWISGEAVGLWAEGGTPGVFVEPRCSPVSHGAVDGQSLLKELVSFPIVNRALQQPMDADDPAMLELIRLQMGVYDVRNVQFRLLVSWSAPWQCRPDKSFVVIAEAKAHGKLQPSCSPCLVVVDLFATRVLGRRQGVSRVGYVSSEADWQAVYAQHAGDRCIKYIDFNNATEALEAASEYDTLPGVGPYDHRHGGVLLSVPDWRRYPPPGWHPDRR
ncbi:hypothetical protein [Pandoraea sp. PE-S2T-3]|uniref:hypothetical protein n=1 Tax=Pandoraea sp. PE-S2T-3 TaxID=1986993 RepID=UPI000B40027C|nr:hypothetical protein [Pandoraea sp. PE-S2T-3]